MLRLLAQVPENPSDQIFKGVPSPENLRAVKGTTTQEGLERLESGDPSRPRKDSAQCLCSLGKLANTFGASIGRGGTASKCLMLSNPKREILLSGTTLGPIECQRRVLGASQPL